MFEKLASKALSRRTLLSGAAITVGGLAVASCTTAQIQEAQADWANVVGVIQQAVSTAAQYIPTVESIAATAASLFGPEYAALVQVGTAAFNQIVAVLTSVVENLPPSLSAKLGARLATSSRSLPVSIGVTSTGVAIAGYR